MAFNYWSDSNAIGVWGPDYSGPYQISGVVRRDDGAVATVRRRVELHDSFSGALVRVAYSSAVDGSYAFRWLAYRPHGYRVTAQDHPASSASVLNAAVADFVTPVPM